MARLLPVLRDLCFDWILWQSIDYKGKFLCSAKQQVPFGDGLPCTFYPRMPGTCFIINILHRWINRPIDLLNRLNFFFIIVMRAHWCLNVFVLLCNVFNFNSTQELKQELIQARLFFIWKFWASILWMKAHSLTDNLLVILCLLGTTGSSLKCSMNT